MKNRVTSINSRKAGKTLYKHTLFSRKHDHRGNPSDLTTRTKVTRRFAVLEVVINSSIIADTLKCSDSDFIWPTMPNNQPLCQQADNFNSGNNDEFASMRSRIL
jgi:hypothetical protein